MDAIAAASVVLTYVLPHLGGVGGDFLALVHRGGRIEAVVSFGRAPKGVPKRPPRRGLQSAVVPGYVAGLYELHRRHGSLPWGRVVDTALEAMEKATMHPSLVSAIEKSRDLLAAEGLDISRLASETRRPLPYRAASKAVEKAERQPAFFLRRSG